MSRRFCFLCLIAFLAADAADEYSVSVDGGMFKIDGDAFDFTSGSAELTLVSRETKFILFDK